MCRFIYELDAPILLVNDQAFDYCELPNHLTLTQKSINSTIIIVTHKFHEVVRFVMMM